VKKKGRRLGLRRFGTLPNIALVFCKIVNEMNVCNLQIVRIWLSDDQLFYNQLQHCNVED
jgi:hypothetical protein